MTFTTRLMAFSMLFFATVAAWAERAPKYYVNESKLPFKALPRTTALWGVLGGAGYRVEVPDDWNGGLVVWAHGFRGSANELTVENHPFRLSLIPAGFAWASSSYARNGYAVASGVTDLHALVVGFSGLVGTPTRVYLTGASMGGHVTAVSLEEYPETYDGALSLCGALGDYELFDYFLDFNAAAQQLGTGRSKYPVDPAVYIGLTVREIKANLEASPGGWPVALNTDGDHLKHLTELRSGGERPNFDEAWLYWNTLARFKTRPGNFLFDLATGGGIQPRGQAVNVDNMDTVYQFDTIPALTPAEQDLNDSIVRVAAVPHSRDPDSFTQVPVIAGNPQVPMLTLHNLGDLFVPFHNEIVYAKRVAANDRSDLLVQRAIRGSLHCDFTGDETKRAFFDLVDWVETGQKPAGDNFLNPAEVADPLFGCKFTNGEHTYSAPCR